MILRFKIESVDHGPDPRNSRVIASVKISDNERPGLFLYVRGWGGTQVGAGASAVGYAQYIVDRLNSQESDPEVVAKARALIAVYDEHNTVAARRTDSMEALRAVLREEK